MAKRHIIIGDGITAAEFATSSKANAGDTITVIGPNVKQLGRGVAYAIEKSDAPWRYAYLLNSPSISVDPEFKQWMPANWESIRKRMSHRTPDWLGAAQYYIEHDELASLNAPRELFGDFFHARVCKKLEAMRACGIHIEFLSTRAIGIEPTGQLLNVRTEDGQQITANTIDVATGGPQNQRFSGDNGKYSFAELFGNEASIAIQLGATGHIICIGAGAAMLDLLRFCQAVQMESNINFTAISPSGTVLEALRPGKTFNPAQYTLKGTFNTAAEFLSAVKSLQTQALNNGHNFYETRVGMRSLFLNSSLNQYIPNITEARKVARPLFQHFQGGTRDSIDDFNRLLALGRTKIIAGTVHEITHTRNKATVLYSNAQGELQSQCADTVVNCAGPGNSNRFDALTSEMLRQQWISLCSQSGGVLVGQDAKTSIKGVRYLGPAVTSIGNCAQAVPLYDTYRLRMAVQKLNQA